MERILDLDRRPLKTVYKQLEKLIAGGWEIVEIEAKGRCQAIIKYIGGEI